jgi:hypothetical protein
MWLLYVVGVIVAWFSAVILADKIHRRRQGKKFAAAKAEFDVLEQKHGFYKAKELCPHRVTVDGQSGVPGVVTLRTKWCKVCGGLVPPKKKA